MEFSFAYPLALLAMLPAAVFFAVIYRKYYEKGYHGSAWPLVLRLVIVLLLVLSLAGLEIRLPVKRTEIVFVADLSDSTIARQGEMNRFISDSLKILPEDYYAAIVGFGGNALIEQSLSGGRSFYTFSSKPDTNYSNIDQALQRAEGIFTRDSRKRIVLLTDGAENMGDAMLRAGALAQRGIPVDVKYLETIPPGEVQLSELTLPSSLYEGEDYDIRVEINSTVDTRGILRLYANRMPAGSQEVQIQKGQNTFLFRQTAEAAGTVVYEAELEPLTDDDTFMQNNRIASYVRIEGPPVVALVEGQEEEGRELARIMEAGGLEYKLFSPYTLPGQLDELMKFDAVILANVGYDELGQEKAGILDSYVKSMGKGMLVTGGDNSYALGGYMGTRLEEMLPVDMDLSRKKEIPSLALVLVIDKSGSMDESQYGVNKMKLAKEAAIRSTQALRDEDFIGVVAFDSAAGWVVEIQQASGRDDIENAIGTIRPGGGTNLYPGLNMAYQALQNTKTALKHVIVLTDGHTAGGNFDSLVSQMAAEGITVSGVAVGQDADSRLMERIAELGNGRFYFTDDYASIPKIFTKETYMATRSYINNETFHPKAAGSSHILRGIDAVPSLDGYITTTIKGGAVPVLVSHKDDDPVLACWDYGLGKVAAWTSDARGIWTEKWLKWDQAAEFWLNTISSVLPGSTNEGGRVETSRTGSMGQVAVSIDGPDAGYDTNAIIVDPEGNESQIKLQPVKPGYYQGNFELKATGVYLIRVDQQRDDGSTASMEAGLIYPYSPEYDIRQTSSLNLPENIAEQTGGRLLQNPEDLLQYEPKPVWRHHEIWPALLTAALFLFFLDIVVRKLGLKYVAGKLLSPVVKALTGAFLNIGRKINLKSKAAVPSALSSRKDNESSDENTSHTPEESNEGKANVRSGEKNHSRKDGKQAEPKQDEQDNFTGALLEARRNSRIRK